MAFLQVSQDEMMQRVARFGDLNFSEAAFLDAVIPEFARKIFNVIGPGVTEDANLKPAISAVEGFNMTLVKAERGKGASLHAHDTVEVFMALTGEWVIYWGDEGENEVRLGTFDVVSVPVGVMRGFRNDSDGEQLLMALIGGDDAGKVTWPGSLLEAAEASGAIRDADGNIVMAGSAVR